MNPIVEKFEQYLANLRESGSDSGWMREAISEIQKLENLLLEERMKVEAFSVQLNQKCNPVMGKRKAGEKRVKELLKSMGIR